jgi:hypothetical protein
MVALGADRAERLVTPFALASRWLALVPRSFTRLLVTMRCWLPDAVAVDSGASAARPAKPSLFGPPLACSM